METLANQNWISDFTQKNGRPPRILHFGNICNNAYQIAKMQNQAGAVCDVLSADYYHFMGAPEWDEANFTGDIKSQQFPAWHKVNLQAYVRPLWFAQGTQKTATAYLLARRKGRARQAQKLWKKMQNHAKYLSFKDGTFLKPLLNCLEKAANFAAVAFVYFAKNPKLLFLKFKSLFGGLSDAETHNMRQILGTEKIIKRVLCDAALFENMPTNWGTALDDFAQDALKYAPLFREYDLVHAYSADPIWPYLAGVCPYVAYENGTLRYLPEEESTSGRLLMLAYARAGAIMLTNTDCCDSAFYIKKPLNTPLVYALHGIDIARMAKEMDAAHTDRHFDGRFGVAQNVPLFFCPARHTWSSGHNAFLKGGELAARAAARLAEEGHQFKLVFARWGGDVAKMEQFLATLPALKNVVFWQNPLEKRSLQKVFTSADAVLDQFFLPVFGAVTFEVLCASHAVLISKKVDEVRMQQFFGASLPYFACDDENDIYLAMKSLIQNPSAAKLMAKTTRLWATKYHSPACILQRCFKAYTFALGDVK